jgi:hypothetical protein
MIARRRRHFEAGPVQVTVHGNPVITVGQATLAFARAARRGLVDPARRHLDSRG